MAEQFTKTDTTTLVTLRMIKSMDLVPLTKSTIMMMKCFRSTVYGRKISLSAKSTILTQNRIILRVECKKFLPHTLRKDLKGII